MNELFRGYVVVVWEGTNITSNKYRVLNAIVVRKCIEFYMKCQIHRNKTYHDEEKQKERIIKQYQNKKERAENSDMQQVKEYVKKFTINIKWCSIETIKTWIKNLKIIEKKIRKVPKNDIRRYLNVRMV